MAPVEDGPDTRALSPTGVAGLDAILGGGLPRGRVTVLQGGPGVGKTILALEVLARGAREQGEPGVFVSFEEAPEDIRRYGQGFEWSTAEGLEFVDAQLSDEVLVSGAFDLQGMLALLEARCRKLGARRVVFDGVDVLLDLLRDPQASRRELLSLRAWARQHGVTTLLTAKDEVAAQSEPHPFLDYASDCLVRLRHRLAGSMALRSVRVVKSRGVAHASDEFAFALTPGGMRIAAGALPELHHDVSDERLSTGVERLDTMLGGGYYRATSVLISGEPGTAKSTLAAAFVHALCTRGERVLYVSFDEAAEQIVRNMRSVGLDLGADRASGQLEIRSFRSRAASPEAHVARMRRLIETSGARGLVVDPISAFARVGDAGEAAALELIDFAKSHGVTVLCTSLLGAAAQREEGTPISLSTLVDTWMQVSYVSQGGERNRALTVIKSRGMAHSNQVRELLLSSEGPELADVYTAGGEVLLGTLRWEREQQEREAVKRQQIAMATRRRELELEFAETEARLRALEHERVMCGTELDLLSSEQSEASAQRHEVRRELQVRRGEGERGNGGGV